MFEFLRSLVCIHTSGLDLVTYWFEILLLVSIYLRLEPHDMIAQDASSHVTTDAGVTSGSADRTNREVMIWIVVAILVFTTIGSAVVVIAISSL